LINIEYSMISSYTVYNGKVGAMVLLLLW